MKLVKSIEGVVITWFLGNWQNATCNQSSEEATFQHSFLTIIIIFRVFGIFFFWKNHTGDSDLKIRYNVCDQVKFLIRSEMSSFNNSDNSNADNSDNSSGGWLAEYLARFLIQSACYIILKHTFEPLVIYLVRLLKMAWKHLLEFLCPDTESDRQSQ